MDLTSWVAGEVEAELDSESEANKLPLKRVELALAKFSEAAIPHHLHLLRQHHANILKYGEAGREGRVRVELESMRRAAARLRALLRELAALRGEVRARDRPAFDARVARALADTHAALALARLHDDDADEPSSLKAGEVPTTGAVAEMPVTEEESSVQLVVDEAALAAREREESLRAWLALQEEAGELHAAMGELHGAARRQREPVARADALAERALEQAAAARGHLAAGARLRAAGGAAAGAALGALAAGPVGLLVGLKAGAAAALAGSLLGYVASARLLPAPAPAPASDKNKAA